MSAWMHDAACADTTRPEIFFPPAASLIPAYLEIARRDFCDPCPVQTDCLLYAVGHSLDGIWAGTTDDERTQLKRRMARRNKAQA